MIRKKPEKSWRPLRLGGSIKLKRRTKIINDPRGPGFHFLNSRIWKSVQLVYGCKKYLHFQGVDEFFKGIISGSFFQRFRSKQPALLLFVKTGSHNPFRRGSMFFMAQQLLIRKSIVPMIFFYFRAFFRYLMGYCNRSQLSGHSFSIERFAVIRYHARKYRHV